MEGVTGYETPVESVWFDVIANASSFGRACDLLRIDYTAELHGRRLVFSNFLRGARTKTAVPAEAIRRLSDIHGGIAEPKKE